MSENATPKFVTFDDIIGPATAAAGPAASTLSGRLGSEPLTLDPPALEGPASKPVFRIPSVRDEEIVAVFAQEADPAPGFGQMLTSYVDELGLDTGVFRSVLRSHGLTVSDLDDDRIWDASDPAPVYRAVRDAFQQVSLDYIPDDSRRPLAVATDAPGALAAISDQYQDMAEASTGRWSSWYGAVAIETRRTADWLDPLPHSMALASRRLSEADIAGALALGRTATERTRAHAEIDGAAVDWHSEFFMLSIGEYVKQTVADQGARGLESTDHALLEYAVKEGDANLLVHWVARNNPEASHLMEHEATREAKEAAGRRPAADDRSLYEVAVDPRNLAARQGGPVRDVDDALAEAAKQQRATRNRIGGIVREQLDLNQEPRHEPHHGVRTDLAPVARGPARGGEEFSR